MDRAALRPFVLNALRQIEASVREGIWDAHFGCAAIAGALLIERNLVFKDAMPALTRSLKRLQIPAGIWDAEQNYFSRIAFQEEVIKELEPQAGESRELGHAVIYSAYVLKALDHFEIDPWESLLDWMITLIRKIHSSGQGWITVNGTNAVRTLDEAVARTNDDYWMRFRAFDRPARSEAKDMQLGHLLTHGHAISMMRRCGIPALVEQFDLAYRNRLRALEIANQQEESWSQLPIRTLDPRTKEYWEAVERAGDMHGHAFKYAYSFLDSRGEAITASDLESFGRILWPMSSI
jgi:hypothetical protein